MCSMKCQLCLLFSLFPLASPQLGGTIGDIEGMPFIEAFRQFQFKVGHGNFCNIHVSLVPEVRARVSRLASPIL